MGNIQLKKGFDIRIKGNPSDEIATLNSKTYAVKPTDYNGIGPIPKMLVEVGDEVKAGDALFFDKKNPKTMFTAPVSGEVAEIRRGDKRSIVEVVILADSQNKYRDFSKVDIKNVAAVRERLLESGAWTFFHQRPYNVIADAEDTPRDIFISGFDNAPLAANLNLAVNGNQNYLQKGVDVLNTITKGKIYLGLNDKSASELKNLKNVVANTFKGQHPSSVVGIQIHHTKPINKGDIVWTINLQDVITIGRLFEDGQYNTERIISLGGPQVKKPMHYKTYLGASIEQLVSGNLANDHVRFISGNPLSGKKVNLNSHVSAYSNQVSVIEEGDKYEPFGWLIPNYAKPSISRTFLSGMFSGNKEYDVNTNTHGEGRAFVVTGEYEKVLPMDIYPVQLLKAIKFNDLDLMEGLGIYEVVEEDLALCEYVCTSKSPVQQIVREGLDMMREQG